MHHGTCNCSLAAQVLSIAGELLSNAEGLLRDGLHTAEVADGYVHAAAKARRQCWADSVLNPLPHLSRRPCPYSAQAESAQGLAGKDKACWKVQQAMLQAPPVQ